MEDYIEKRNSGDILPDKIDPIFVSVADLDIDRGGEDGGVAGGVGRRRDRRRLDIVGFDV